MNWHNKTILESMALIGSEIGEAMAECVDVVPTDAFGSELADIILRILDLSQTENIDLDSEVEQSTVKFKTKSNLENLAEIMIDFALWTNTVRKKEIDADFGKLMAKIVLSVVVLANKNNLNLEEEIIKKMSANELKGTRGRVI